jgi:hypothetical protein
MYVRSCDPVPLIERTRNHTSREREREREREMKVLVVVLMSMMMVVESSLPVSTVDDQVYVGNGCFWALQHLIVSEVEYDENVTAVTVRYHPLILLINLYLSLSMLVYRSIYLYLSLTHSLTHTHKRVTRAERTSLDCVITMRMERMIMVSMDMQRL